MKSIFGAIADLIEDKIRDRKLRWMVAIPSALASALVAFGVWSGLSVLVNATLACTAVFLGVIVSAMAIARRYMRRQIIQKSKVVSRYADAIYRSQQNNANYFSIFRWLEKQDVVADGDTTIVREIGIRAGSERVPAVWARASRSSTQHLGDGVRGKIKIEARYINDDDSDGTRLVTSHDWESDKGIRITVFLDHDLDPNKTVRIRLTIFWPRYSADLLTGEATKEYWLFHRAIDELSVETTYSKVFAPNGIKVTPLPGTPIPAIERRGADGSSTVALLASNPVPQREYGYHVEIG